VCSHRRRRNVLPPVASGKPRRRSRLAVGERGLAGLPHRDGRTVVLDFLKRYRPPFNPHEAVQDMVTELRRFSVRRITGDNYAADFVSRAFEGSGIRYVKADKPKSQLYVELLPRLCSREIELLDNDVLVNQLAGLERRTRSGGKDIIDHPPGGHDDLANAVVVTVCDIDDAVGDGQFRRRHVQTLGRPIDLAQEFSKKTYLYSSS
jgi:hypothetical protein